MVKNYKIKKLRRHWKANSVRLPFNEDFKLSFNFPKYKLSLGKEDYTSY